MGLENETQRKTKRGGFYGATVGAGIALWLIFRMNDGIEVVDHDGLFAVGGLILAGMECVFLLVLSAFGAFLGRGLATPLEPAQGGDTEGHSNEGPDAER